MKLILEELKEIRRSGRKIILCAVKEEEEEGIWNPRRRGGKIKGLPAGEKEEQSVKWRGQSMWMGPSELPPFIVDEGVFLFKQEREVKAPVNKFDTFSSLLLFPGVAVAGRRRS